MVRPKKFALIMCVNQPEMAEEALHYVRQLEVPDGYSMEILTIEAAMNIAAGYNEGMQASDAKYKIYIHQDVFLLNRKLLYEMLRIFENPQVGMIGLVGSPKLPGNGIMWYGKRIGSIYISEIFATMLQNFGEVQGDYQAVEAIDGLFMATQYDLSWREDILDGWDFYDVSQSMEFRKQGYQVVVPNMDKPWCLHNDGKMNLKRYYEQRRKVLMAYLSENR